MLDEHNLCPKCQECECYHIADQCPPKHWRMYRAEDGTSVASIRRWIANDYYRKGENSEQV